MKLNSFRNKKGSVGFALAVLLVALIICTSLYILLDVSKQPINTMKIKTSRSQSSTHALVPTLSPTSTKQSISSFSLVDWKQFDDEFTGLSYSYPPGWGIFIRNIADNDVREGPRGYFISAGPLIDKEGNIFDTLVFQGIDVNSTSFELDPNLYYSETEAAPANEPQPFYKGKITQWQTRKADDRQYMVIDVFETSTTNDDTPFWSPIIRRYVFDHTFTERGRKRRLIADVYHNDKACGTATEFCAIYTKDIVLKLSDLLISSVKFHNP